MFEKLADKLNKRIQPDEEITFKNFDEETAPVKEEVKTEEPMGSTLKAQDGGKDASINLKLIRPESFDDVSVIADHLLKGCTVVLNVEALDSTSCLRMLDFLNGVTYSTGGEIKNVAKNTYIITPNNVDISADE